jgi:DNA-binding CsgD family transcriptional regulator
VETGVAFAPDLLERADDLSALGERLNAVAESGQGRLVLVSGEAGVGKTTIVRLFCSGRDARVLWGDCDPLYTPRPLGPLYAMADEEGGELRAALARGVLPHEVVSALAGEMRNGLPTIFVLEDLHWADEATLDVLRLLCRRLDSLNALVVATFRDDELDRAPLLRIVLGEIAPGRAARLKLAPLSPGAVTQLAEPHGVDPVDLYRKTAGNPFFVVEALAAGGDEVPETVRDAVFARAARMSAAAGDLLAAVAVAPPQAELWLLETLAGSKLDALEECVTAGMLRGDAVGVMFRHELARLAVEESIPPNRKRELHRAALDALASPPFGRPDFARLAHHAESAGDTEAVIRYAPVAAAAAASVGAHREATAQYARALRFGTEVDGEQRAEWLELQSRECYLTDQYDEGIKALQEAAALRRAAGVTLREADDLRRLGGFFWCPGRVDEAERAAREAVDLLEELPPSRELAAAYTQRAFLALVGSRRSESIDWAQRALAVAEGVGDRETFLEARARLAGYEGLEALEAVQQEAARAGHKDLYADIFVALAETSVECHQHEAAERFLADGIAHCSERGFELYRLYLLAARARLELQQGRWSEAADTAESVVRVPRTSTTPRILSLVVLGLVRGRRGDPGSAEAFEEARALAEPTGELLRMGPVAAARAEAAWLTGDHDRVAEVTERTFRLAIELDAERLIGELGVWRRRAGLEDGTLSSAPEPYALELAGEPADAAKRWRELGCPYEAALALAGSDARDDLQFAHDELQRLEAKPAAGFVAQRLREVGGRVSRGPRPSTRENPANLTARELEVLTLVARGLRNADVAKQLFLSEKTVGHHVSAILRKLDVRTRGEAGAEGARLGILLQDGPI